jgi:hypothetical protein
VLGYGNQENIGDDEHPSSVGFVDFGNQSQLLRLVTGFSHACAVFADGANYCYGSNGYGMLGYGNLDNVGDDETPASVGPIAFDGEVLGATFGVTCGRRVDGKIECWGKSEFGSHGYPGVGDILEPPGVHVQLWDWD